MVLQFDICKWCLICMIQQAYKYLSSSFWPCLMFCKLRDLKRVSCHENRIFYSPMCVFCRTISLPSFNGLRCKLVKIHCSSVYILGDKIGLSVWHHQSSHLQSVVYFICIFYPFLKLKCISGTNADICQRWTAFWFFQGILCDTPKKHRRTSRGGGGGCRHPSYKNFWNCSCKTLLIRAKYSGENTLKGSRSQTWRLLSLTFALSRRGYLRSNNLRIRVFVLEKPYIVSMCIAEIHEMDITSNKKTMTESKQTKTKTFVFVVALKWVVLNGSTKSCFQFFLRFTYEEEFTVFDFNKLSIEVIEYARFQNN